LIFDRLAPVHFWQEMDRMNAERHRQVKQLREINPQRAIFNFGNGAARGILPASILQPVGQIILRPGEFVTPFADLSPDKIPLFHCEQKSCRCFYQNSLHQVVMKSLQLFGLKTDFPRHGKAMLLGSGGHQTDSKLASVLANKPQER